MPWKCAAYTLHPFCHILLVEFFCTYTGVMVRLEQLSYNIVETTDVISVCVQASVMSEGESTDLECEIVAELTTINSIDLKAGKITVPLVL